VYQKNTLTPYLAAIMIKNLLFLFLVTLSFTLSAQIKLSEESRISVITCGPTQTELYSAFGHTAIRVYDPSLGMDDAYNYGLFSFNQPHFYLNFARGSSFYILGVQSYPDFQSTYIYFNRSLHEQVLNLNIEQKQNLFNFLQWNAQLENRSYRYDYFYDNCATRVRDAFSNTLKGQIKFDSSYIKTNYSIRDLTELYLSQQPWGDLGIDICLGLPMDKKISPYEYMFLPDYIESSFDHATINREPLVKSKTVIYEAKPQPVEGPTHPWIVFGVFLLITIGLSLFDWKRRRLSKWFDVIVFTTTGLLGILLVLLWTATDHKAAANNLNLLWALPTNLLVFGLLKKSPAVWIIKYFQIVFIISGLLIASWSFLPQQLNIFLMPLVAAIMIRAFVISKIK
jgi:Domain of unknown function (DUF4105)